MGVGKVGPNSDLVKVLILNWEMMNSTMQEYA